VDEEEIERLLREIEQREDRARPEDELPDWNGDDDE
jgi:hypothetical protein